ncbi:MAG: hypothetical protein V4684_07485 [Pseudomonadota bacterium]
MSAALIACGGGNTNDAKLSDGFKPTTVVAFAAPAMAREGQLSITTLSGDVISKVDFAGNASTQVSAPADIRLVLQLDRTTGNDGSVVKGNVLSARALNYSSGQTIVISPLSTMIDAYMAAHPGISPEQAQAKVLDYFGLAQHLVASDLSVSVSPTLFDNKVFFAQAALAGSVDALAKTWVAEIDAGQRRSVVARHLLTSGGEADLVFDFLESLAGSFDNWAGGKIQGWLLQVSGLNSLLVQLGLSDGPNPISGQLDRLSKQVDGLIKAVDELPKILDMSTRVTELKKDTDFITRKEREVATQASASAIPSATFNGPFFTEVNAYGLQDSLQRTQMGVGDTSRGMINVVRQINFKYYSGKVTSEYDKPMFDLFNQSVINQTRALNLLIEGLHSQDPIRVRAAEEARDVYYINLKRQKQSFPNGLKPFADGSVLDRQHGLLWKAGIYEYSGYEALRDSLVGNKWRLPTIAEVRDVMPRQNEIQRLPAALRGLSVTQSMRYYGFEPDCFGASVTSSATCKDFTDMGPVGGAHGLRILSDGYVVTSESYQDSPKLSPSSYYYLRAWVVDLRNNGAQEGISVKWCEKSRESGYREVCYRDRDHNPIAPWLFPVWLTREPPTPVSLKTEFTQGFDPATGRTQARAYMLDSDGNYHDVTKEVIWTVAGDADEVHISNAPDTSGQVQYRGAASPNPPKAIAVTAEYPWYLTEKLNGNLKSPDTGNSVIYGNDRVVAPVLASLLLSPGQTEVNSYLPKTGSDTTGSVRLNLRAVGVMNTGLAQNQDPASITWTLTADTALPRPLTVSNGVLVIPEPGTRSDGRSRRTLVQITGTKGAATGKAYVVLN